MNTLREEGMTAIDLSLAKNHLWEGRTISGLTPTGTLGDWFEMYRDVFLDNLERMGVRTDEELAQALKEVIEYKYVGDFITSDSSGQLKEFAAFGLVVFDRLTTLCSTSGDVDEALFITGQLAECFEHVVVNMDRLKRARSAAAIRHSKGNSARQFVEAEWKAHVGAYNGNKSSFARDYVKRVWNEYNLQVTEKQMRDVWLRNTPNAGKPVG